MVQTCFFLNAQMKQTTTCAPPTSVCWWPIWTLGTYLNWRTILRLKMLQFQKQKNTCPIILIADAEIKEKSPILMKFWWKVKIFFVWSKMWWGKNGPYGWPFWKNWGKKILDSRKLGICFLPIFKKICGFLWHFCALSPHLSFIVLLQF